MHHIAQIIFSLLAGLLGGASVGYSFGFCLGRRSAQQEWIDEISDGMTDEVIREMDL